MKILIIDNYDSFTYNLYQLLYSTSDSELKVVRNNELTNEEILLADAVVISPGPGLPKETNNLAILEYEYINFCNKLYEIKGISPFNIKTLSLSL